MITNIEHITTISITNFLTKSCCNNPKILYVNIWYILYFILYYNVKIYSNYQTSSKYE